MEDREQWIDYFTYMDELRRSGVTNMFAVTPYISLHFKLSDTEAKKVLKAWADTFSDVDSVEARVDKRYPRRDAQIG
jgi:hypothetical protein